MREAAIVLAAIVRRYRFTLGNDARVGIAPLVTLRPAGPVMLRPFSRVAEESSAAS